MPDEPKKSSDLQPLLGDLVSRAMKRLVGRSRRELGRAAESGRQRLALRQHQKDLDHFWIRLGKTAFRLVEAGEIDHPALRKAIERIDELEARIDELRRTLPDVPSPEPEDPTG